VFPLCFFNLMIDAILRAAEVMMMAEHGPHENRPELYADDGRIGGRPELIQSYRQILEHSSQWWA
jgi:hypothetical protein